MVESTNNYSIDNMLSFLSYNTYNIILYQVGATSLTDDNSLEDKVRQSGFNGSVISITSAYNEATPFAWSVVLPFDVAQFNDIISMTTLDVLNQTTKSSQGRRDSIEDADYDI